MSLRPTQRQVAFLSRSMGQAGGKLSLFDEYGQEFGLETIEACIRHGWAEPWFDHPIGPGWLVCRLTDEGARVTGIFSREEVGNNKEESSI